MNTTHHDAIVVGAGQSGLAAAWALNQRGIRPVVLEAGSQPGGSWPHYYDSLTLFSPARYSALPDMAFPGDPDCYPHRDDVVAYLRDYAGHLDAKFRFDDAVTRVHERGGEFTVSTSTGQSLHSPLLVAATGGFGKPHTPDFVGRQGFTGRVLHASAYREPAAFAGQRVVVVGAGNSAIQISAELAEIADVSLASRAAVQFVPQRPLGRDMHFWFTVTGIDSAPVGPWLRHPPSAPVFDEGAHRAALRAGRPDRRPMFERLDADSVVWPDGSRERLDTVLCATGYRPALDHLAGLEAALDAHGRPRHRRGLSTTHPGLGYLGLEWQRSLSSSSLRGVGRDARYVVDHLLQRISSERSVTA